MMREYRDGRCPSFSFEDGFYRLGYMYQYASANSLAVHHVLSWADKNERMSHHLLGTEGKVSVCCLGGGPGTEIVGIAKWIARQQLEIEQLEVVVTDKYPEWGTEWKAVSSALNSHFCPRPVGSVRRSRFVASMGYVTVDVEDPNRAQIQALKRGFDLYVASYVVSHIFTQESLSRFQRFLQTVIGSAPQGSKFLFIDRRGPGWENSVAQLLNHPEISISEPFHSKRNNPGETSEQKSDLGVLYERLNRLDIDPRLGWDIFWVVGTKV